VAVVALGEHDGAEFSRRHDLFHLHDRGPQPPVLPDAERVRELANEAYRIGQTSLLSVIDATRNAREVRQAYLQALFDYQTALADLEQAAGVKM